MVSCCRPFSCSPNKWLFPWPSETIILHFHKQHIEQTFIDHVPPKKKCLNDLAVFSGRKYQSAAQCKRIEHFNNTHINHKITSHNSPQRHRLVLRPHNKREIQTVVSVASSSFSAFSRNIYCFLAFHLLYIGRPNFHLYCHLMFTVGHGEVNPGCTLTQQTGPLLGPHCWHVLGRLLTGQLKVRRTSGSTLLTRTETTPHRSAEGQEDVGVHPPAEMLLIFNSDAVFLPVRPKWTCEIKTIQQTEGMFTPESLNHPN